MKRNHSNKKTWMEQSRHLERNPLKATGVEKIDYKDVNLLHQFTPDRGKIRSCRVIGLTPQQQHQVVAAMKSAQGMAPLPFTSH